MKTSTRNETAKQRLEYLRGELRAERISLDELHELQSLARYIKPGDVELLEAAGVPEFPDEDAPKHTPGKWTANSDGQIQCENVNQYGNFIVAAIQRELTDEDRANARLLAAAPELLAIAKHLLHACETPGDFTQAELREMMDDAAAAIARATGGEI